MDDRTGSMSVPSAHAATEDTEERARAIRSEIDQTREDLSETVDAIQEKLRPANLVSSAASATTEKVKDMAHNAADTAEEWWDASGAPGMMSHLRAHPIPTTLAAVGLAWLALADGRGRRRASYGPGAYDRGSYDRGTYDRPGSSGSYDRAAGSASYASSGANERSAGRPPNGASYAGRDVGRDVSRMVRRSSHQVESMIRDYPLAVGAAALILGASLGLAVPETERENEIMGEARDTALEKAQAAATTVVGQVKEAAADVVTRATIGD